PGCGAAQRVLRRLRGLNKEATMSWFSVAEEIFSPLEIIDGAKDISKGVDEWRDGERTNGALEVGKGAAETGFGFHGMLNGLCKLGDWLGPKEGEGLPMSGNPNGTGTQCDAEGQGPETIREPEPPEMEVGPEPQLASEAPEVAPEVLPELAEAA